MEWEILLIITIWYSVLGLIFLVAFLTAIFEVKVPIKFDKITGQMIQILPQTKLRRELMAQGQTKRVSP